MQEVPQWWPDHPPIYDPKKSYDENFDQGPFFDGEFPERSWPDKSKWIDFLGQKIASPLGVPAGPLLNSKWTTLSARLGFDVVTYKTMRSQEQDGHPLPNILYVDTEEDLTKDRFQETLHSTASLPGNMADLAITNSFGMPSKGNDFLMADIEKGNSELAEGQVMIVSVVGTPREDEDFAKDFAKTAALAKEAGAKIIEANFSCPNVTSGEGSCYVNPTTVDLISKEIVKEIGDTPLVIKVGYFEDTELMKEVFISAAKAGVRAICGINTIGMPVVDEKDLPALGPERLTSGICGEPIQAAALDFVNNAVRINQEEKLDLTIMGVGGITLPEHFDSFLDVGADIALTATGMMWDPYLAMRYHHMHQAD